MSTGQDSQNAQTINQLQHESYLLYFDLPLLTLLRDEQGRPYLDYWCDLKNETDRRLIFRVNQDDLNLYLARQKSLRQLVLSPAEGFYYMVDASAGAIIDETNVNRAYPETLDKDYIPDEDSYHDPRDVQ